eukprot:scaffold90946_cov30-Tisochrysis_lutea.AAC.1
MRCNKSSLAADALGTTKGELASDDRLRSYKPVITPTFACHVKLGRDINRRAVFDVILRASPRQKCTTWTARTIVWLHTEGYGRW